MMTSHTTEAISEVNNNCTACSNHVSAPKSYHTIYIVFLQMS